MSEVKQQIDSMIRAREVVYVCAKCKKETPFKIKEEKITCSKCQGRVLYKKRTSEPVEFEAR